MAFIIPTFPDVANYVVTPTLDGTQYELTFRLSEREACWYVDLTLNDGTQLVMGKKIVCSISLFAAQRYNPLVPQGHLVCVPCAGQSDDPPNLGELGDGRRCFLGYFAAGELGV